MVMLAIKAPDPVPNELALVPRARRSLTQYEGKQNRLTRLIETTWVGHFL